MIRFSNGHELTFACGSGALAFDGRGWWWEQPLRWCGLIDPKAFTVVAKTVTLNPRRGNLSLWHPWTCVRLVKDGWGQRGVVNAIGLTNPGLQHWVNYDYCRAIKMGYRVAASVSVDDPDEARVVATMLRGLKLAYVEVNISCPNVGHQFGDRAKSDIQHLLTQVATARHPIVLKLGCDMIQSAHAKDFIGAVDPWVEAYHAINTIPYTDIFGAYSVSPIQKYPHERQGGVSGPLIHTKALECVSKLKHTLTSKPVIGGGGIMHLNDVYNFEKAGAGAFSIGSCFLLRPWRPNRIARAYAAKT